ncbi:MAG: NTP transferase domain-containing protein [Alphaproteobacteria bacterium]|nr:NTP transferase domain-containing protein [Alphaproteobacteria bacterium]MBV9371920.1 NTP transferase domain-containing protein [Alphaproteobacteria bacterium]MBV9900435.1 NTP transferase domain-containing protein [Alphaproteobacteria bacterium]
MIPNILVLAGRRSPTTDPLAASAGVTHKAMVPVKGEAMVGRVLRIAEAAWPAAPLYVSVDDFAAIAAEPTVARLVASGRLTPLDARANIVESVVEASRTTGFPLLITTADNVLMTPEGMRSIDEEGRRRRADAVVMMAEKADILAAHPDGQRRFYAFRGGAYSNCNLFWLGGDRALKATESFRLGGQFAKHKRRAVKALGVTTLLLYLSRLLTLDGMFRHFSRRFGLGIRALVAKDGRLAIDVDNERTHRVAEELLSR